MFVHHGGLLMKQEMEGGGGGRKKGRSVCGKVEETLTCRSAGAGRNGDARVGYFEIPWTGCRGRRRRLWTPKKKRAKRVVTETTTSRSGKRVVL